MNEDWNPVLEPGASLEHPLTATAPDKSLEKQDTLNSSGSASTHPRAPLALGQAELPLETPTYQKRLESLAKSPGFKLIGDSLLLLKASQLDMDYPPTLRAYVREQLKHLLRQATGRTLSPDKLSIRFRTGNHPEVDDQGRERYSRRMTLTEIGVLSFNDAMLSSLLQYSFTDSLLDETTPALTAQAAINLIINSRWFLDYPALMKRFWTKHRDTYRTLAKLSFLDKLARQYARKLITREGYELALDALGLEAFPDSGACLAISARGVRAKAHMLSISEQELPDAFQLQSLNTSHCFVHMPGGRAAPVEYISDEPAFMKHKLIEALNNLPGQPECSGPASLIQIDTDIFTAVTAAQEKRSLDYIETQVGLSPQPNPLKTIERGLSLLGAVDIWQSQPSVIQQIPAPLTTAARVMAKALRDKHGWVVNPDKVFIRYLRGHSTTPLGDARHPALAVNVPDEKPISLSKALLSNYRVASPTGYIDNGGRHAVYFDDTGKGVWSASQELPMEAQAIENAIREIDFLNVMRQEIDNFWEQHKAAIEAALQSQFMTQALSCLKHGEVQRDGFDLIVTALEQLNLLAQGPRAEWSIPGFFLQHSLFEGPTAQYCPSLLVLSYPGRSQRVLYQAGALKAFIEFRNEDELHAYLRNAGRSQTWRESVLNYVPMRHQARLAYILKVLSREQPPDAPVSLLRPWTDVLLNHDTRLALASELSEQHFTGSPFAHIRTMLKQNCLWNADDTVVTSREVSLRYWTRLFQQLQFLLAPMSILLTPALIASLATELGVTALNISAANLPGARYAEKQRALLSVLSLALLQMSPSMPRLAQAFRKLATPIKPALGTAIVKAASPKSFGTWLGQSMRNRDTRFEKFFHTDTILKASTIAGHPGFATLAVKAWKLQRQFLLWTGQNRQARTLVVSSHGYHLPWSKSAAIPNGTELRVYAPHGHVLVDPRLHRVVSRQANPFAALDTQKNTLISTQPQPYVLTDKLLAGTSSPGMIKNYSLAKFQSPQGESYRDISHIVRNSNQSPFMSTLPPTPMDVLTIRNRFGMPHPTLETLFKALADTGIHYDRILLVHCRCSLFQGLKGTAPVYQVP